MKERVIIAGGGPAGMVAALASARNGADTLLIEQGNCLGGVATSGSLSFFGPFDNGTRGLSWEKDERIQKGLPLTSEMKVGERIIKGIPEEILNRLIKLKGAIDRGFGFIPVNPESLKFVAEEMLRDAGVDIIYHTLVMDVIKEGVEIKAVMIANKSGCQKIEGRIFVDATGDADLAFFAKVPFQKGRKSDGKMQGVTLVFRLGGVKIEGCFFRDKKLMEKADLKFKKAYQKGEVSELYHVGCINAIPGMNEVVAVNTQHTFDIDGTKPEDLTNATINGRRQIREIVSLYKKHIKGFENSFLLDTASYVGVRETRRVIGEYMLTKEDVLFARDFSDSIGRNAYNLDIHIPLAKEKEENDILLKAGTSYAIPYRSLIPKGIENLIVAGRCISATHEAQSSIRIMPCCMVTGQAAGTAAALCLKQKVSPRNLDIKKLQDKLRRQGASLR